MIDSTPAASSAVVDERRPAQPVVEDDAGGQAGEALQDALARPARVRAPWRSSVSRPLQVQKIVGCAMDDRAESVEVGAYRGLRANGDVGTAGFGLSALLSLPEADLVESII
jgi:hypothetical protein